MVDDERLNRICKNCKFFSESIYHSSECDRLKKQVEQFDHLDGSTRKWLEGPDRLAKRERESPKRRWWGLRPPQDKCGPEGKYFVHKQDENWPAGG